MIYCLFVLWLYLTNLFRESSRELQCLMHCVVCDVIKCGMRVSCIVLNDLFKWFHFMLWLLSSRPILLVSLLHWNTAILTIQVTIIIWCASSTWCTTNTLPNSSSQNFIERAITQYWLGAVLVVWGRSGLHLQCMMEFLLVLMHVWENWHIVGGGCNDVSKVTLFVSEGLHCRAELW